MRKARYNGAVFGVDEGPEAVAPVRALRANPPGRAADGRRGQTFGAALEQFEQLLVTGSRVPPASAPILLFYALTQAGRAILAAHAPQPWEVHGHGLSVAARREPIGETMISPDGNGLFQAVAAATHSAPLTDPLTLAQVWGRIPQLPRERGLGLEEPPIFTVGQEPQGGRRRVVRDDRGTLLREADRFTERGDGYPAITGAEVTVQEQGEYTVIVLEFQDDDQAEAFDQSLWDYLGQSCLRAGDAAGQGPSGLMMWWMLLQALSQLARYEPAGWTRALSPDLSGLAVPLERTLRRASGLLPRLVLEALTADR